MKILLIGATGTLGSAVHSALQKRDHQIVTASRSGSDISVDITDPDSIRSMYERAGRVDAVANTAGSVPWKPFTELSAQDMRDGLTGKALSQIELVRQGSMLLGEEASFTLITGVLIRDPVATGSVASTVNGAVEAFVRAAAIELPHRQRINAVSPTVFAESMDVYGDLFAGFQPVPVAVAADAYIRSIEGRQTGQVYTM